MKRRLVNLCLLSAILVCFVPGSAISSDATRELEGSQEEVAAIAKVLDAWHLAAAKADEEAYFKYFAKEGVFFGTDATERWTKEEFQKYAHPHFAKGKAWTFRATKRNIFLSKDRETAWFDEDLETMNLGPCRGTGVLIFEEGEWKIVQYNLSTPIPNSIFDEIKKLIAEELKMKSP